jgi:hypothetical protein
MQSLALASGQSGSSDLTLVSDGGLAPMTYPFNVGLMDSDSSISIHSKSVSGSAVIQAAPVCSRMAPSLSLSPSSQMGLPGEARGYSLKIVNNDSSICSPSDFGVVLNAASPLSGSLVNSSVNLAAGASGSIQVSIQSDSVALAGNYSFSLDVLDSAQASHSGSVSGVLQVQSGMNPVDQVAPSAPQNLVILRKLRRSVVIQWDASVDASSGIANYQVLMDGVKVAETTRLSARIRIPSGVHSLSVKAVDHAGNISEESAPLSVELGRGRPRSCNSGRRRVD